MIDQPVISAVPQEYVIDVWPKIEPFMEEAASYTDGKYTADDILNELYKNYILWIAFTDSVIKGAVVTCFSIYPRKKYLSLLFCGGVEGPTWKAPMLSTLQSWAKDNDCDGIEALGRDGWERIFRADGFTPRLRNFELPLTAEVGA